MNSNHFQSIPIIFGKNAGREGVFAYGCSGVSRSGPASKCRLRRQTGSQRDPVHLLRVKVSQTRSRLYEESGCGMQEGYGGEHTPVAGQVAAADPAQRGTQPRSGIKPEQTESRFIKARQGSQKSFRMGGGGKVLADGHHGASSLEEANQGSRRGQTTKRIWRHQGFGGPGGGPRRIEDRQSMTAKDRRNSFREKCSLWGG